MGKLQRLWTLSLVWLLIPPVLDTASEVMLSVASEQVFSKTDNCKSIRDMTVTLPLYTHL